MDNRAKECFSKKRLSEDYALKVIKRAKKGGTQMYHYFCTCCGGYHVTRMKDHSRRIV